MIAADAPVEVFDEIDSTMLEARRRADAGAFGPVWLQALKQNAGRGRRGRSWVSEPGNLYVTYLAPADRAPADLALLGFAAGLAICNAVDSEIGHLRTQLKWPNDAMVDGAKISGLMLDSGGDWFALGMGINIARAPEAIDQAATSVEALAGESVTLADVFGQLRASLAYWDQTLTTEGFEPLRRAWLDRARGLGEPARVVLGETIVQGTIAGLSSRGELELDTEEGRRLIAAGDVLLPNAA